MSSDLTVIAGLLISLLAVPLAIEYWVKWLRDKGFFK